tara:strand:- start:544 stop:864 length:321 start_codon:yes stop_codon:yes gene_type:complete
MLNVFDAPYKLIVIDSIISTFRAFNGCGELSGRQQKLGQHLDAWKKNCQQFKYCCCLFQSESVIFYYTFAAIAVVLLPVFFLRVDDFTELAVLFLEEKKEEGRRSR